VPHANTGIIKIKGRVQHNWRYLRWTRTRERKTGTCQLANGTGGKAKCDLLHRRENLHSITAHRIRNPSPVSPLVSQVAVAAFALENLNSKYLVLDGEKWHLTQL